MGSLLLPLPVLAIVLAGLDSALARWAHPWRAGDVRLFFHAYFLWAAFGCLALVPARLTLGAWDARARAARGPRVHPVRPRGWDGRPWLVLLAWMVLPVVAVTALDEHTSLVGFAGLLDTKPWLELGASVLGGAAVLALLGRWLGAASGVRSASFGVLLAVAAGLFGPALAAPSSAGTGPARPNLLLLVWDTCRADKLEPYGCERPTSPGLTALAQESIVFEDSLSASSFTFTSHLSLLTGLHPATHGAHLRDMRLDPARAESIAALLARAGYRTGAFVGTDVLSGRTGLRAGFEVYDDQVDPAVCDTFAWRLLHALQAAAAELVPALRFNGRPHWVQDFQRPGGEVLERALAWIGRDDPRPWFCFVNLYDVHWPYVPEEEGRERLVRPYDGPLDGYLFRSDDWHAGYRPTDEDKRHVADLYEGEVFDLDRQVARFLERLELERGGTAVVVTADHGEALGEQDTWNHDDVLEPQVRVPLVVRRPEPRPRAERLRAPASGVDVAPTLLALAGIAAPVGVEGRDLLAPAGDPARERWIDDRDHLHAQDFRCALYRDGFKLVRSGAGSEVRYELHDLAIDPGGSTDVQARHPELFRELVTRMEQRSDAAQPLTGSGDLAGSAALHALGYAGD